ncbi:hypothetical protein [uncultured Tessaracoccus sp.]|uniref:hypothetical protein n=1 Tax=uncultured Tessaracoccus sp. TaxID=905023 RepID=UPI0025D7F423|nr:hypothetical protein [uncultured Tessaracoccus sp.]
MPNPAPFLKAATGVLAATATLLAALKDTPQIADGVGATVERIRKALRTKNPKQRMDAKIEAIEAAADTVESLFGRESEAETWRTNAATLRTRTELAWTAQEGRRRRHAMRVLSDEASELLARINTRLAQLAPGVTAEGRTAIDATGTDARPDEG